MARVVVITGASSGVGKALALQLSNKDNVVYATMRNPKPIFDNPPANLIVSQLDVTDDNSVNSFLLRNSLENVDVLVNNAGYAINGTHEQNSIEQVKQQFDTNFFGVVRMHSLILPLMRACKSGHVIGVSSVGGILGVPFNDIYCASKFALEGLYESMSSTNRQFGIQTTLINPGPILTEFTSNSQIPDESTVPESVLPIFQKYRAVMTANFAKGNSAAQTADEVASVIVQAIEDGEKGNAALRYPTSPYAQAAMGSKLVDVTGNTQVNNSSNRFFK